MNPKQNNGTEYLPIFLWTGMYIKWITQKSTCRFNSIAVGIHPACTCRVQMVFFTDLDDVYFSTAPACQVGVLLQGQQMDGDRNHQTKPRLPDQLLKPILQGQHLVYFSQNIKLNFSTR